MEIDFGGALAFAWDRLKANPGFYLVGVMVIFGASIAASVIAQMIQGVLMVMAGVGAGVAGGGDNVAAGSMVLAMGVSFIISTLLGLIVAPVYVGYFKGIKHEYEGGTAEIGEIFSGIGDTIPSVVNYFLADVVVLLGTICCIIPGILLSPIVMLSMYHVAHGENKGIDALKKSFDTLKKAPIVILWSLVLGLFASLGVFACIVGLIITVPLSLAAMYAVFRQAEGDPLPGTFDGNGSDVVEVSADQL